MNSEAESGATEPRDTPQAGAGDRLRAAREARKLDLAHIAAETRIPLRHLEAIEKGDFAGLPSRTYAIGFSRTYAKAVGLDPVAITDAVRAELGETEGRRTTAEAGLEPGDPARLPSSGLAWFAAFAGLVLAVGLIAFYNTRYGAGADPAAPVAKAPTPAPAPDAAPAATPAPTGGEVIFTALDQVWVRIYEQGGDRLVEKELAKGERFALPADASDPRINTARPDLLAISVGGKSIANLAPEQYLMQGQPVSAAALLARTAPQPASAGSGPTARN